MDNLRVFITLIIVIVLALLSVFQMQIRGFEKVGRMEEWVLYLDEPGNCAQALELIYTDEVNNYYLPCLMSDSYIVKSGFEENELIYALEEGLITIEELDELIIINIIEK
jgi:hypothetical protein